MRSKMPRVHKNNQDTITKNQNNRFAKIGSLSSCRKKNFQPQETQTPCGKLKINPITKVTQQSQYHLSPDTLALSRRRRILLDSDDASCNSGKRSSSCDSSRTNHTNNDIVKYKEESSNTTKGNGSSKTIHDRYKLLDPFAKGTYGEVCYGQSLNTKDQVAIKIILKKDLRSEQEQNSILREISIHRALNHSKIIRLIEYFEDNKAYHLVLNFMGKFTLVDYMKEKITEKEIKNIIYQILKALDYLHKNGVVHHDIKPSNVLLSDNFRKIKLCDFGASRKMINILSCNDQFQFEGVYGTSGYLAPEVLLHENYGYKIDIWSTGIILFEMLYRFSPFYPPSACLSHEIEFPEIDTISENAKDLIQHMLDKNPKNRYNTHQVLNHPWLNDL